MSVKSNTQESSITILDGRPMSLGKFFYSIWKLIRVKPHIVFGPLYILYILLTLGRYTGLDLLVGSGEILFTHPRVAALYVFVYSLLWIVTMGFSFLVLRDYLCGEKEDAHRSLKQLVKRLPHVIAVSLLCVFGFLLGYIALIIPGIVVGIFVLFAPLDTLASTRNFRASLRRSVSLVLFHNWFFVFLLVASLLVLASLISGGIFSVLSLPFVDQAGVALDESSRLLISVMSIITKPLFYGICLSGLTILYVAFSQEYDNASEAMRANSKTVGCVGYGCLGFFLFLVVGVIALVGLGYNLLMSVVHDVITPESVHIPVQSVGNTLDDDSEQVLLGNVTQQVSSLFHQNTSGVIVLDEATLDAGLRSLATGSFLLGIDIVDNIATIRGTIALDDAYGWTGYIDGALSFSLVMQDDAAMIEVYSGFLGSVSIFEDIIGQNSFFWSDFSARIMQDVRWQNNLEYEMQQKLESFLGRIKEIRMESDAFIIHIDEI